MAAVKKILHNNSDKSCNSVGKYDNSKLFASHESPQTGIETVSLLQGETNKFTMTVGDLQTPLSQELIN